MNRLYPRPAGNPRCFYFTGDRVLDSASNVYGTVQSHSALYAVIRWDTGEAMEIDQVSPDVTVVEFAPAEAA